MNDPHVVELAYRIKHADNVDYKAASALDHDEPGFSIRIDNGTATIKIKDHHASEDSARAMVKPFLKAWELSSALDDHRDRFEFEFQSANVVDRRPTPGAVMLTGVGAFAVAGNITNFRIGKSAYPPPPDGLECNADVEFMWHVYRLYCDGRTVLSHAAYYCLTVLELVAGSREKASKRFGISTPILRKLGTLSSEKGGKEGRKAKAASSDYTPEDRAWLESAMKTVIRRAAQVAYDPNATQQQITMDEI